MFIGLLNVYKRLLCLLGYVCIKRHTKMIVCFRCDEPVTSRLVLFTRVVE